MQLNVNGTDVELSTTMPFAMKHSATVTYAATSTRPVLSRAHRVRRDATDRTERVRSACESRRRDRIVCGRRSTAE